MKTVKEVLALSCEYLKAKDEANAFARRDVEDLLAHVLQIKRLDLYVNFDRPLEENELVLIRQGLKRLAQHEPIQYIEGEVNLSGCRICVDANVLIPRPETELLVERVVQKLQGASTAHKALLDLCCGSGYIGLAIKRALPELTVVLSDLSKEAVALSKKNAAANSLDVTVLEGDLFAPLGEKKVHYLVCNPPYLAEHEFDGLDLSVKNYEPKQALIAGPTGLELYERIAKEMKKHVFEGAWFEIGATQGKALVSLFYDFGYRHVRLEKDLSGHDRFLMVSFE